MGCDTRVRSAVVAIAGIAALAVVGGCSGSSKGSSAAKVDAGAAAAPARASAAASSGAAAAAGGGAADVRGDSTLPVNEAAKIRTADLTVVVTHGTTVTARADLAARIATRAGGEIDTDDRTAGKDASATQVFRVPPQQLSPVLDQLGRQLGKERSRHVSTQDVTAKVADVSSRVASAQQAIARLRGLYAHAVKVSDVISIESELSSRESDLESLQAQQRALAKETSTAVITLTLLAAAPPPPTTHHRTGFVRGLASGWDAFTRTLGAFATGLGAVLPFVVLMLVLGAAGRLLWVQVRARRPAAAGGGATPPAPPQ
jgi:hypothetical protein